MGLISMLGGYTKSQYDEINSKLFSVRESLSQLTDKNVFLDKENDSLKSKAFELQEELKKLDKENEDLVNSVKKYRRENEKIQEDHRKLSELHLKMGEDMTAEKEKQKMLAENIKEKENYIKKLESDKTNLVQIKKDLEKRNLHLQSKLGGLTKAKNAAEDKLKTFEGRITEVHLPVPDENETVIDGVDGNNHTCGEVLNEEENLVAESSNAKKFVESNEKMINIDSMVSIVNDTSDTIKESEDLFTCRISLNQKVKFGSALLHPTTEEGKVAPLFFITKTKKCKVQDGEFVYNANINPEAIFSAELFLKPGIQFYVIEDFVNKIK